MSPTPWYRSKAALWLASLALPPVGLAVLWTRGGVRLAGKLLGSVALVALGITYLVTLFGLRAELDGSGMFPILSFHKPEAHIAELERSRHSTPPKPAAELPPSPAPVVEEPKAKQPAEAAPSIDASTPARLLPAAYWADFRGPNRDGRYDETPILTQWPAAGLERLWKQPIGGGYGSFVVADGQAFTIEQRRDKELVAAYDLRTGRELWTDSWPGLFQEFMGGDGPRSTPTWHDGRLYALGALGEFRCLDAATGRRLWSRNILKDNEAQNTPWGMAASPLVVDDKVIVLPGGPSGNSVVAYEKVTGKKIWGSLDDKQAYTSPMLVTLAGKRQLLVVSAKRAMGLTVEDGALLWEFPWTTAYDVNAAQPIIVGPNRLFISAGYDHGAALVEVTVLGDGYTARPVWENKRMKNKFSSSVLHEGHIYGFDESILACVNAETGELKWKGGRYGYGQLLLASGHLVVSTEAGDVVLVKATPERHEELGRFSAIEGKTWNVPAIADGNLLVRNATEMACFRIAER